MRASLTGTWSLTKLALRRDRILLPIWIAIFVSSAAGSAAAGAGLFPTTASRMLLAETTNGTPMLVALYGRVYEPTIGALSLLKLTGGYACAVAVFAFILVIRHTRKEEETGRLDVVASTAIGPGAPLAAAWILAVSAVAVLSVLSVVSLIASGLPMGGSLAFGLDWFGVGLVFAAIGGFTAQLSARARVCTGIATAVLGASFLLRAVGDSSTSLGWLSWLSPIGWAQQLRPFAGDRWFAFVPTLVCATAVGVGAVALAHRRDLGQGLLPDRPGPASASRSLTSPIGLAWRLERGSAFAWLTSFAVMGMLMGAITSAVGDALNTPQARALIEAMGGSSRMTDAYLAAVIGIVGMAASAFGILASLRLHAEEVAGRSEIVLAGAVGRARYVLAHVAIAFGVVIGLMVVAGVSLAIGISLDASGTADPWAVIGGALAQIPSALLVAAIPVALFGIRSRIAVAAWTIFGVFVLLGEIGPMIKLPGWALDLSPFAHAPKLPGGSLGEGGLVALLALAIALVAVGTLLYRRRDISA